MPSSPKLYQIFIANPSDVEAEADILISVIRQVDAIQGKAPEYVLRPLHWRQTTHPDVGTDPQAVVSEQMGTDFDIFVGVFGSRIGTATPRAESGTAEEYEEAVRGLQKSPPRPAAVMLYFSQVSQTPRSQEDINQLQSLMTFRNRAQAAGALTGEFSSIESLRSRFMVDLQQAILRIHRTSDSSHDLPHTRDQHSHATHPSTSSPDCPAPPAELLDEDGFLDLMINGQEAIERANESLEVVAGFVETLGNEMREATAALNSIGPASTTDKQRQAKRVVNLVAGAMERFADRADQETPQLRTDYVHAIESLTTGVSVYLKDIRLDNADKEDLLKAAESIVELQSTVLEAKQGTARMRDSIRNLPRATSRLARARRRAAASLGRVESLLDEFGETLQRLERLLQGA